MNIKNLFIFLKDIFQNIFFSRSYDLIYIVEGNNWSINWDGRYITESLNRQKFLRSRVSKTHFGLRNKVIHFGSINTLLTKNGIKAIHPSNWIVLTWFHIITDDKRLRFIHDINRKVDVIHASCDLTKQELIKNGIDEKKIKMIHIGVDLTVFKQYTEARISQIKKELDLPENKIIIGSFQKDGIGWQDGLEPKIEKGPDIFCNTVEKLSTKFPIHILLTGPSRGYIKKRLKKANIAYTHKYIEDYSAMAGLYNALDFYLITSRKEGGPKAILESMACGIPVISTPVGMGPEIIIDGENGLISKTFKPEELSNKAESLMDSSQKDFLIKNGLKTAKEYDWDEVVKKYYYQIYKKYDAS